MFVEATDLEHGIRLLTLSRPPANAINADLNGALYEQCRRARDDAQVKAVIVTGAGRFFSAGLDLKEAAAGPGQARDFVESSPSVGSAKESAPRRGGIGNFGRGETDGLFALWTMPKPTVAMVNGHAIAGGMIIALACDFRVAAAGNHRFGLNEVAIGIAFPIGAFEVARLALDDRSLRYAALEAGLHDASRARELGLVDEVVAPAELQTRCVTQARTLAAHGALAYAHTKGAIQREAIERVRSETPEQLAARNTVFVHPDTQARLRAQVEALSKPR